MLTRNKKKSLIGQKKKPEKLREEKLLGSNVKNSTETLEKHSLDTNSKVNSNETDEKLRQLYLDIKSVPNYSAKIAKFLQNYPLHSRNKRISKKIFPRRRVVARFPFDLWQADLIEYPNIKWYNNGYKFILLVIDCFTKVIYCEKLKKKTADLTSDAMLKILDRAKQPPVMLVTDGGREFFNSEFEKVMISNNISHFRTATRTPWKASLAERANRTIKTKIARWMQKTNSKKWIDVYEKFVDNYNKVPHSSHGFAPQDVTEDNAKEVYKKLYPLSRIRVGCKLKIGDKVRILVQKQEYEKGYTPKWSEEVYTISKVLQRNTICWYHLADHTGKRKPGIWYYYQLNLVARNDT